MATPPRNPIPRPASKTIPAPDDNRVLTTRFPVVQDTMGIKIEHGAGVFVVGYDTNYRGTKLLSSVTNILASTTPDDDSGRVYAILARPIYVKDQPTHRILVTMPEDVYRNHIAFFADKASCADFSIHRYELRDWECFPRTLVPPLILSVPTPTALRPYPTVVRAQIEAKLDGLAAAGLLAPNTYIIKKRSRADGQESHTIKLPGIDVAITALALLSMHDTQWDINDPAFYSDALRTYIATRLNKSEDDIDWGALHLTRNDLALTWGEEDAQFTTTFAADLAVQASLRSFIAGPNSRFTCCWTEAKPRAHGHARSGGVAPTSLGVGKTSPPKHTSGNSTTTNTAAGPERQPNKGSKPNPCDPITALARERAAHVRGTAVMGEDAGEVSDVITYRANPGGAWAAANTVARLAGTDTPTTESSAGNSGGTDPSRDSPGPPLLVPVNGVDSKQTAVANTDIAPEREDEPMVPSSSRSRPVDGPGCSPVTITTVIGSVVSPVVAPNLSSLPASSAKNPSSRKHNKGPSSTTRNEGEPPKQTGAAPPKQPKSKQGTTKPARQPDLLHNIMNSPAGQSVSVAGCKFTPLSEVEARVDNAGTSAPGSVYLPTDTGVRPNGWLAPTTIPRTVSPANTPPQTNQSKHERAPKGVAPANTSSTDPGSRTQSQGNANGTQGPRRPPSPPTSTKPKGKNSPKMNQATRAGTTKQSTKVNLPSSAETPGVAVVPVDQTPTASPVLSSVTVSPVGPGSSAGSNTLDAVPRRVAKFISGKYYVSVGDEIIEVVIPSL